MSLLHIAVILPLIFALIIPILYRFFKKIHLGWFVLPIPVVLFIYFLSLISTTQSGNTVIKTLNWMPHIGMNFDLYLDGLSILFSLLITGIGSLVVLYSIGYLSKSEQLGNFYCYLLLFMGAMLGVVLSDNLIILYLFWELTSFSSFYLSLLEKKGIYLWCTKVINHYRIWWIKFIRGFILISLAVIHLAYTS